MNWHKDLINEAHAILDLHHNPHVSPSRKDAIRFFQIDPLKIKIVIIGQDPYPQPTVANGRAFAVNKGIKIPASLKNIFKEIKEVYGSVKTDETLEHWENQGVLLLNKSLTLENNKPNSHQKIWADFSEKLITWISQNLAVTWVLWGKEAQKLKSVLKNQKIIIDAHPSPLSYYRRNKNTFKLINQIDW